jgi:hypothetical protein
MARLPEWARWLLAGGVVGGVVVALLAPALFLASSVVDGEWTDRTDFELVPFVAVIGGVWGGIGGLLSGAASAVLTRVIATRGRASRRLASTVAAAVTAALVTLMGVFQLTDGGWTDVGSVLLDVAIWIVVPASVCATVAYLIGGRLWLVDHVRTT